MTLSYVCRSRLIEKSKRLSRQHRQLQYNRIRVAPFQAEASKQPEHDHLKKSIKKGESCEKTTLQVRIFL